MGIPASSESETTLRIFSLTKTTLFPYGSWKLVCLKLRLKLLPSVDIKLPIVVT